MFTLKKIFGIAIVVVFTTYVNTATLHAAAIPKNLSEKIKADMSQLDYYGFQDTAGIRSRAFAYATDKEVAAQLQRQQEALKYLESLPDEEKTDEVKQLIDIYKERVAITQKELNKRENPDAQEEEDEDINTDGSEPTELDLPDTGDSDLPTETINLAKVEGVSVASSETITPSVPLTITTKVTTIKDGQITTETTSGTLGEGGVSVSGDTGSSSGSGSTGDTGVQTESSADKDQTETDKSEDNETYTGIYKEQRLLFPTTMAIHCKMNAEDVLNDMSKLDQCIRQYVSELNSRYATAKATAIEDFNLLRHDVLKNMLMLAVGKKLSVNNYENQMNQYGQSTSEAKTERDTEASTSNTQAFSTNVMNTIREVYIEILKINAISGFGEIDPVALTDAAEKSEKAKSIEEITSEATEEGVKVEVKIEQVDEGDGEDDSEEAEIEYVGNNQCASEGTINVCEDGTYKDEYGNDFTCEGGICVNGTNAEGVVIEGDANAKQYLEKFRAMDDKKLARQKAQYQSILKDPSSNEEQKREAEKGLRYVEQVESERK